MSTKKSGSRAEHGQATYELEQRYLTLKQAAALSSLSVRTIRRAIAAGQLAAYRIERLIRISLADFVAYMERHRLQVTTTQRSQ